MWIVAMPIVLPFLPPCPVSSLSGFCPLDLYSCSASRVRRALEQLLQTPQNNMRLFVRHGASSSEEADQADDDGGWVQMVDLRDAQQIAQLVALLLPRMAPLALTPVSVPASAAASTSASLASTSTSSPHRELLLSFLTSFLTRTPAMRALFAHLAHLQQQLDYIDIEGAFPHYEQMCMHAPGALAEERLWRGVLLHEAHESEASPAPAPTLAPPPAWVSALLDSLGRPDGGAPAATAIAARSSSIFVFPHVENSADDAASSPCDITPICARWADSAETPCAAPCAPVPSRLPLAECGPADACETRRDGAMCRCQALLALRAFLLSTTLKDVSIMCTMQSDETEEGQEETGTVAATNASITAAAPSASASASAPGPVASCRVHYSVRLIDLECKSVDKMREYHRLDRHIVQFYNQQMQLQHAQR